MPVLHPDRIFLRISDGCASLCTKPSAKENFPPGSFLAARLYKQYRTGLFFQLALEDINFHVDEGEFVFLLGHSGAGKSTLLKLILREALPTSGKVTVLGKDVAKLRRRKIPYLRRQMGIIFQDFRLIPSMTVYENVAFAMHVLNVPRREIRPRVEYILELVHLEDKAKCYPDTLSGGEQQRVAVARALVHNPKLVIADEPTGNIDPELRNRFYCPFFLLF